MLLLHSNHKLRTRKSFPAWLFALALLTFLSPLGSAHVRAEDFRTFFGDRFQGTQTAAKILAPKHTGDAIRRWNEIAINATGLDHTPVAPGETRVFGEQLGPGRSSRAMAMVHIAIFDALNSLRGQYRSYTGVTSTGGEISASAAISQAAHDALAALYPSQKSAFDTLLSQDLLRVRSAVEKDRGVALGRRVAATLLAMRSDDGSARPEPRLGVDYSTSRLPGHWRQDPVSLIPVALGAHWGECTPFVLTSGSQFRLPPPPALTSPEYAEAYDEVKRLGGDGTHTPTHRTAEQTFIGTFWAYDGTPSLCAPPRLYNQLVVQVADRAQLNSYQLARLLALTNVAMADAAIAGWDSKFHWDFWRPITGIRESDSGTGPTGRGDGNPDTIGDRDFMPLGAPASNLQGPNFTPPFPSYPSGHADFGGAVFQVLRRYFGRDDIPFTFISDEFNGSTRAADGTVRPYLPRSFSTFSQAERENARSRIYLGIHWSFDAAGGIRQGREVGNFVFDHAFTERN